MPCGFYMQRTPAEVASSNPKRRERLLRHVCECVPHIRSKIRAVEIVLYNVPSSLIGHMAAATFPLPPSTSPAGR